MKAKTFPALDNFEIVETVDDELKIQIKKYKLIHAPMLANITGMSQPTIYKALRRLARDGLIVDKGINAIKVKGESRRRYTRLYERA